MVDVFDKEKRSTIMRNIKSKGNKSTELAFIKIFYHQKITGWKRGYSVKGHPGFVFLNKKIAIFVDGCFWHGHSCKNLTPKSNDTYWSKKINDNIKRDIEITELFNRRGWRVIRIWECELKKNNRAVLIQKLRDLIEK